MIAKNLSMCGAPLNNAESNNAVVLTDRIYTEAIEVMSVF